MRIRYVLSALIAAISIGRATIVSNTLATDGSIPASVSSFGGVQVQGSDFGGPDSVSAWAAAQFTPDANYSLTEIDLAIGNNGGPGDSNITIELYTDSGGLPGVQYGSQSWNFTAASGSFTDVYNQLVSGVFVAANTPYWLVAIPGDTDTTALWALDELGIQGPHAYAYPPDSSFALLVGSDEAFAIQGIEETPEPSTWTLIASGLAALAWGVRPRPRRTPRPGS